MQPLYHQTFAPLDVQTEILERDTLRIRVASSPFYPGGGGQPQDAGWVEVGGEKIDVVEIGQGSSPWLTLSSDVPNVQDVNLHVDPSSRRRICELHTATHVLNALVFREFDGALVTGAQLASDGTARLDFDLPGADNERLRALESEIERVRSDALSVCASYVTLAEAQAEHGLIRSKSVTPPPSNDGMVRIVEIDSLDRQACGGTHVQNTSELRPVRITKVENKGRQNRRIRIALVEPDD